MKIDDQICHQATRVINSWCAHNFQSDVKKEIYLLIVKGGSEEDIKWKRQVPDKRVGSFLCQGTAVDLGKKGGKKSTFMPWMKLV